MFFSGLKNKSLKILTKFSLIDYYLDFYSNNNKSVLTFKSLLQLLKKNFLKKECIVNYDLERYGNLDYQNKLSKKFFVILQYFYFLKTYMLSRRLNNNIRKKFLFKPVFLTNCCDFEPLPEDYFEDYYTESYYFFNNKLLFFASFYILSYNINTKFSILKTPKSTQLKLLNNLRKSGEKLLIDYRKAIYFYFNSSFLAILYSIYFTSLNKDNYKITKLLFNKMELIKNKVLLNEINNFTPLQIMELDIRKKTVYAINFERYLPLDLHIGQYIGGFLESLTSRKICIKVKEIHKKNLKSAFFLKKLFKDNFYWQRMLGTQFYLMDMLKIMYFSFLLKDLLLLNDWFCKSMTRLNLKKHKIFLRLFKFLLFKYERFFLTSRLILGFKFDIRGKVGVAGNSKKRHTSFYIGTTSFAKKSLRLEYQQGLVYTSTGVLGSTMMLAF